MFSTFFVLICHPYNSSNITNDDIVLDLVRDTLKYLPQRVDSTANGVTAGLMDPRLGSMSPDRLRQMTQKKLSQDPLAEHADQTAYVTVLRQEINRFDKLLGIIYTSLSSLRLAVKGEVLMSEQLEEAYNALLNNRVPKAWEVCNYSSISLLVERLHGKVCNSLPLPSFRCNFFEVTLNRIQPLLKYLQLSCSACFLVQSPLKAM